MFFNLLLFVSYMLYIYMPFVICLHVTIFSYLPNFLIMSRRFFLQPSFFTLLKMLCSSNKLSDLQIVFVVIFTPIRKLSTDLHDSLKISSLVVILVFSASVTALSPHLALEYRLFASKSGNFLGLLCLSFVF